MKEPIRKIELKDGTVRYRLVVDIGRDEKVVFEIRPVKLFLPNGIAS